MAEEWVERVGQWLTDAERELARFDHAVAHHGLHVIENGQDVTGQSRQYLQGTIEEYRRLLAMKP
jgi:hypothetical protein